MAEGARNRAAKCHRKGQSFRIRTVTFDLRLSYFGRERKWSSDQIEGGNHVLQILRTRSRRQSRAVRPLWAAAAQLRLDLPRRQRNHAAQTPARTQEPRPRRFSRLRAVLAPHGA